MVWGVNETMQSHVKVLLGLNATAASLLIVFGCARHLPLEVFPASWRKEILRWRKAHSRRANLVVTRKNAEKRSSPFDVTNRDAPFKAWPAFNDDMILAAAAGLTRRQRLELRAPLGSLFCGSSLWCKVSRALAAARALDRKEFFETCEFFEQVRRVLRCSSASGGRTLCEVAGGHGLLGVLVACFERERFDEVLIIDIQRPPSFASVLSAVASVAPWVTERVRFVEADFRGDAGGELLMPPGCAVACVHGCNSLTDDVLRASVAASAESIAVMPCCYSHAEAAQAAPRALRRGCGVALAADVERTYRLERDGYGVEWRHIPSAITPMNRVLVARRAWSSSAMVAMQATEKEELASEAQELCDTCDKITNSAPPARPGRV